MSAHWASVTIPISNKSGNTVSVTSLKLPFWYFNI